MFREGKISHAAGEQCQEQAELPGSDGERLTEIPAEEPDARGLAVPAVLFNQVEERLPVGEEGFHGRVAIDEHYVWKREGGRDVYGTTRVQHLPDGKIFADAFEQPAALEIQIGVPGSICLRCCFTDSHSDSYRKYCLSRSGIWGIISIFWRAGSAWRHGWRFYANY